MFAATSNNPDFYDYQIEVGAVGVYCNEDGSYCTTVTIDGQEVELSDGAWGCVAYSAITSLYEADMALAMEYTLNTGFTYNTDFQQALAAVLAPRCSLQPPTIPISMITRSKLVRWVFTGTQTAPIAPL